MVKNIAFVWAWGRAKEIFPLWYDGLRAAVEIIGKKHKIDWVLGDNPEDKYDFILVWGTDTSPILKKKYKCPMGLCYGSTFPPDVDNLRGLSVIYVENSITYDLLRRDGLRVIKAFGTDTDFFSPKKCKKDIEYFYPATFSPWKRQSTISKLGSKLMCVGDVQPDGQNELQSCIRHAVRVIPQHTSSTEIRDLYRRSENVIIPARYGSERTTIEAMSMNMLPEVTGDNDRVMTYLQEFLDSKMNSPRAFIKKYYSAEKYAEELLKGME